LTFTQRFSFFQHGFDAFSLISFVGDYFDGQFMVHDFATFASEAPDAQGDLVAAWSNQYAVSAANNCSFLGLTTGTEKRLQTPNEKHLFQGFHPAHILIE
jgi:hypothetical protein